MLCILQFTIICFLFNFFLDNMLYLCVCVWGQLGIFDDFDVIKVLLTTPTTPADRMKAIVEASEGFVYLVRAYFNHDNYFFCGFLFLLLL